MSEAAREYIRQAITDFWGERCDIPDEDCPTCMVWAEFDKAENAIHIQRNASQDPEGTWSDGGKEWNPDEVSFKAGWDKAKQLLWPEGGFDEAAARITELEALLRSASDTASMEAGRNYYRIPASVIDQIDAALSKP